MNPAQLDALVAYYESLTLASVERMGEYYAPDAYFKDPFNEVRRLADIQVVFHRMYDHITAPRFAVTERVCDANGCFLVWDFEFRMKLWRPDVTQCIHGVTHLRFNAEGKVTYHRDYWDAAEELYQKLPLVGLLMRGLKSYVK